MGVPNFEEHTAHVYMFLVWSCLMRSIFLRFGAKALFLLTVAAIRSRSWGWKRDIKMVVWDHSWKNCLKVPLKGSQVRGGLRVVLSEPEEKQTKILKNSEDILKLLGWNPQSKITDITVAFMWWHGKITPMATSSAMGPTFGFFLCRNISLEKLTLWNLTTRYPRWRHYFWNARRYIFCIIDMVIGLQPLHSGYGRVGPYNPVDMCI